MTGEELKPLIYEIDPADDTRLLISTIINDEKRSVSFKTLTEEQFLSLRRACSKTGKGINTTFAM